jgi:hypothetical protein
MQSEKALDKINGLLDKKGKSGILIQIAIGVLLAIIFYVVLLAIMRTDSFAKEGMSPEKKNVVPIFSGIADSGILSATTYNTVLPFATNYMAIVPSVNMKGGAQFSYSFWINVMDSSAAGLQNAVIFMKGDKKKYGFNKLDNTTSMTTNENMSYLTYCPMFSFGNSALEFKVQFNSVNNVNEMMYVSKISSENPIFRKNIASILQNSWMLITIVFEDNMPINDFENGVRLQFYLNDMLYDSAVFKGMLKQNQGNLFFFPAGALSGVRLSDMKYYNYAVSHEEVKANYQTKPSLSSVANIGSAMSGVPIAVSDKNILDVYNL